jgi:hypothetical protein
VQINSGLVLHVVPLMIAYSIVMVLFLKNRRDMKRLREEALESARNAAAGVSTLSAQVEGIRSSVRQIEEAPVASPSVRGINLNKRAQALRMYRRGETIPSIAAALRTPTHEVQLLLKVHHLINS